MGWLRQIQASTADVTGEILAHTLRNLCCTVRRLALRGDARAVRRELTAMQDCTYDCTFTGSNVGDHVEHT
jgi:hypothetical protein